MKKLSFLCFLVRAVTPRSQELKVLYSLEPKAHYDVIAIVIFYKRLCQNLEENKREKTYEPVLLKIVLTASFIRILDQLFAINMIKQVRITRKCYNHRPQTFMYYDTLCEMKALVNISWSSTCYVLKVSWTDSNNF